MKWLLLADDGQQWLVGKLLTRRDFFGRRYLVLADDTIAVAHPMIFRLILPYDEFAIDLPTRRFTITCHDRVVRYDLVRYFPEEGFWVATRAT